MGFDMPLAVVQDNVNRGFELFNSPRFPLNIPLQILFLNKLDLFTEKIQHSDIRHVFPDYEGEPQNVEQGKDYFRKRFLRLAQKSSRTKEREIYVQ